MSTKTNAAALYERREQLKAKGFAVVEQSDTKEVWAPPSGFPRIELNRALPKR